MEFLFKFHIITIIIINIFPTKNSLVFKLNSDNKDLDIVGDIETGFIEEKWCPSQCECFNNLETVDCSRRGLTLLPSLSGVTHKLYLENNQLEDIPESSFNSSPKLQVLILEHNRLFFVTTASFCSLHYLQELDLSSNQLSLFKVYFDYNDESSTFSSTTLPLDEHTTINADNAFEKLKSVESDDDKMNIHSGNNSNSKPFPTTPLVGDYEKTPFKTSPFYPTFDNEKLNYELNNLNKCVCVNLKEINLSHNQLKNIPYAVARFAPKLEIFNLANNQITSLRFDATYSFLSSLRYLDISRNDIRSISFEDLQPFKTASKLSLETINLSDCGLLYIHPSAFLNLPSLTSLSLARSLVNRSILENVFASFPPNNHLTRLDLSEMFLSNITLKMLSNFQHLTTLVASYCDVEKVEENLFVQLSNLETIHLEGGQLVELNEIEKLKNLRKISLHLNQLEYICLNGSQNLEYVDLSYNKFSEWRDNWLFAYDEIQLLNMSHNQLVSLSSTAFKSVISIVSLDLSHNAISTLTSLGPLKVTHLFMSSNSLSSIEDDFFDTLHQTLVSLDLSSNRFTQFPFSFKIFHQLQSLNLANNKLGGAFKSDKLGNLMQSLQSVQILDLSSNGISIIQPFHLQPLTHLHTLLLNDNKIRALFDVSLDSTKLLSKLVVSHNQLHTLNVQVGGGCVMWVL